MDAAYVLSLTATLPELAGRIKAAVATVNMWTETEYTHICQTTVCHFLHTGFLLGFSSTLKMEGTCSSETSVDFQRTTQHYIPEARALHNHRCENLKSYNASFCLRQHFLMHCQINYVKHDNTVTS
jgi:hypothetical protein